MESIADQKPLTMLFPIAHKVSLLKDEIKKPFDLQEALDLDSPFPAKACKGEHSPQENPELMPENMSFTISRDSFGEPGSTSFHGVSHPLEPIDTDLMTPVYVPIRKNNENRKCSGKTLPLKAPFMENRSRKAPSIKPSPLFLSPLQNMEASPLEEKECIWDASLPPSGNVSPRSSIDSVGFPTATSITNSYGLTSDGNLSVDRNYESTKTSISRASDSSGLSEDSNWSNISGGPNKPHKGNDPRWKAILAVWRRDGNLGMSHFRLLRRLGCGDIGNVYLSELCATRCYFAMKVMDKACLADRKKLRRAKMEREILQLLDHPFLPTLYTHFETDRFSCLVMEYCPGGDLHTLRQRQPGKHFSEYAARFYAAEVLLALEYLHMLGVIYRDLKPENVLVRDDGHIMLSDFDLSLRCTVSPTVIQTSALDPGTFKAPLAFCMQPSCIEPASSCSQPSCFLPRIFPPKNKKKLTEARSDAMTPSGQLPELVAEPTAARSMSFVGTHEYLAPEIIKGEGHGSAVDWWTFGILLHELLYGKTPFKGSGNRATLFNVVGQQLKFPDTPPTSYAGRDLIRGLLVKEPQNRLGVKRGATEIKQHPFFEGVNWALIRCSTPPEVPRRIEDGLRVENGGVESVGVSGGSKGVVAGDVKSEGKYLDFEFF